MQTFGWFQRAFEFDAPAWMYPSIVERVRGTPPRLDELVRSLDRAVLTRRDGERWSIQEHAGHLWDVEALWTGRLDDFEAGRNELRAADIENKKTHQANHNANEIGSLLAGFRAAREALVVRLESYDESFIVRAALHPRLAQPMRVIDLAYFAAEHDDHHLARISELKRAFG